jgi:hypothetical protein
MSDPLELCDCPSSSHVNFRVGRESVTDALRRALIHLAQELDELGRNLERLEPVVFPPARRHLELVDNGRDHRSFGS